MKLKMWPTIFTVLTLVVVFGAVLLLQQLSTSEVTQGNVEDKEKEEFIEKGPGKRDDWFMTQKGFEEDVIPRDAFRKAREQANELKNVTAKEAPGALNQEWEFNAPSNIGGRIVDVVVDPHEEDTIYIGAASGGVWKSTDAGDTFEVAWDDNLTQSIGAVEITNEGTLFVGTGEANPGGGSIVYGGSGVYRSTDGGESWEDIGLKETSSIGRIMADPEDPNTVYVAATGPLFHDGGERGLYKTEDGGDSWELILEGENLTTGAIDIAIDHSDTDTLFVTMWDRIRYPSGRQYGGEGTGLYRSTDGGDTWEQLTDGLPDGDLGRMGIALSKSNPDRAYLTVIQSSGYFEGLYITDDGGDSWEKVAHNNRLANSQSSFGWWFGRNYVDPNDEDHVFVSGVNLLESTDGGENWSESNGRAVHADQHSMAWDPKVPGRVYLGNDGGVYRSEDNGSVTNEWVKATYEPYTQFYTLAVSHQDPSRLSGGTQDNGSIRSWGEGEDDWNNYNGGDGLENQINYEDYNWVYACYQYGNCSWSDDGGETMNNFTRNTVSDRRNWLSPLEFDPNDPSIMYYAGNIVNRSTDGGKTWEAISPSLSDAESIDNYPYGTVTTLAVAKSNSDVIYAGTDDGRLWTTKDLGENWTEIDEDELPGRWVTRVAVDSKNADIVYATFSGFRAAEDDSHVLKSTDGGETWEEISSNLPDAPVNDIVINPKNRNTLYVATDVGVYVSPNGGKKWYSLGEGIPLVAVTDLEYHEPTGVLYAATFGRGVYEVELRGW
ncbi:glycosyl hydrolase [Ornithinibacillus sp. L9]|uniref:Glycosyl hydrolase n=1 Tax=Ornithinibacillus caprae TaxID=2678566 RepID=A0A6N8FH94_9BACI|nr:glycosyl hydrolase [Ornithinibacillus caprae]MUK88950.1 glycosyl hydrolase [Ornithinibacillus caprae]